MRGKNNNRLVEFFVWGNGRDLMTLVIFVDFFVKC